MSVTTIQITYPEPSTKIRAVFCYIALSIFVSLSCMGCIAHAQEGQFRNNDFDQWTEGDYQIPVPKDAPIEFIQPQECAPKDSTKDAKWVCNGKVSWALDKNDRAAAYFSVLYSDESMRDFDTVQNILKKILANPKASGKVLSSSEVSVKGASSARDTLARISMKGEETVVFRFREIVKGDTYYLLISTTREKDMAKLKATIETMFSEFRLLEKEPQSPTPEPLYYRLGGKAAINAVVDTVMAHIAADRRINVYFAYTDIPSFKAKLADQLCEASGGPCRYNGRDMQTAHQGMGITDAAFDALIEDFITTLTTLRIPDGQQQELLRLLQPMRRTIVTPH